MELFSGLYDRPGLDRPEPPPGYLWPRWVFLRALGVIFFSAFYALAFQLHGLIGERGILPAAEYLRQLATLLGPVRRVWYAPTLFWLGAGDRALTVVVWCGLVSSILLIANLWPRAATALCTVCFLSCVAALQDFSAYQSDGMLMEAGFISIFFAPRGVFPGLGAGDPPSRLSLFMLRWEWFRIYFESGVVKLASGDVHWRNLTAMDEYYQNGPLPTWIGWYVQHLPHAFHAATVVFTLLVELVVVWAVFLPRRVRIACCAVVTVLQLGIIATANYAFLNYLVLALGVLLLDDGAAAWLARRFHLPIALPSSAPPAGGRPWKSPVEAAVLGFVLYATVVAAVPSAGSSVLGAPARLIEPLRIANAYGLFATMTEERYEIEFQGSNDGKTWVVYPFRYKPQDPHDPPAIYAPYQPRFDWNLWFASLGPWRASTWVVLAQARLLEGSPDVLRLFRGDPFRGKPPAMVRTVIWQYWFTDWKTQQKTGAWWRRRELGAFTGVVARTPDGRVMLQPAP